MMPSDTGYRLSRSARGVRILDLTQYLPGPLATLLLADMGAEVVKIEPPGGDPMQQLGPRDNSGRPVYYEAISAGKTTRRMDLKEASARDEFLDLVGSADVLVEGFRPGTMRRLGLDYAALREINPGLIYCAMSGWGQAGPEARVAGHDGNYLAIAGILHRNGADRPDYFDPPVADTTGALFAVIAILGALNTRREDGRGCEIDLALADAPMPLQLFQIADLGATGAVARPGESYLNGGAAFYRTYETRDGRHVMLGAVEHKFWNAFCVAAERPQWIARQAKPTPQTQLISEVADFFRAETLEQCLERFEGVDCCLSPILDLRQALETPHHRARGLVRASAQGDLQALFPALVDGIAPPARPRAERIGEPDETTPP